MASIRRLWLNVLFLLLTQRDKYDGFNATQSMINSTQSMINSTQPINSNKSINSTQSITSTANAMEITSSNIYSATSTGHTSSIFKNAPSSSSITTTATNSTGSSITSVASASSVGKTSSSSVLATSATNIINSQSKLKTSSDTWRPVTSSTVSSTVVFGVATDHDSEPKKSLYVWQMVAIGCGAFVFVLFIIIGLLCYQNRVLRKKLNTSRSYSLPIKNNGAWIDSQDIPLWQKRASAFVSENPTAEAAPTLTT